MESYFEDESHNEFVLFAPVPMADPPEDLLSELWGAAAEARLDADAALLFNGAEYRDVDHLNSFYPAVAVLERLEDVPSAENPPPAERIEVWRAWLESLPDGAAIHCAAYTGCA